MKKNFSLVRKSALVVMMVGCFSVNAVSPILANNFSKEEVKLEQKYGILKYSFKDLEDMGYKITKEGDKLIISKGNVVIVLFLNSKTIQIGDRKYDLSYVSYDGEKISSELIKEFFESEKGFEKLAEEEENAAKEIIRYLEESESYINKKEDTKNKKSIPLIKIEDIAKKIEDATKKEEVPVEDKKEENKPIDQSEENKSEEEKFWEYLKDETSNGKILEYIKENEKAFEELFDFIKELDKKEEVPVEDKKEENKPIDQSEENSQEETKNENKPSIKQVETKEGVEEVLTTVDRLIAKMHRELLDKYREENNLSALGHSDRLTELAEMRANELAYAMIHGKTMEERMILSPAPEHDHLRLNGDAVSEMNDFDAENIASFGYGKGTNIGSKTDEELAKRAFDGFVKSKGHNANMLKENKKTRNVGIGIAKYIKDGIEYISIVQLYGRTLDGEEKYTFDKNEISEIEKERKEKLDKIAKDKAEKEKIEAEENKKKIEEKKEEIIDEKLEEAEEMIKDKIQDQIGDISEIEIGDPVEKKPDIENKNEDIKNQETIGEN